MGAAITVRSNASALITGVPASLGSLGTRLFALYHDVVSRVEGASRRFDVLGSDRAASRDNLLAYVALRERDIYELQIGLAALGLSSLGRLEGHVVHTLTQVLARLGVEAVPPRFSVPAGEDAARLLQARSAALLGRPRPERRDRIMVTLDASAADRPGEIESLLQAGMDVVRLNCAHDSPDGWRRVIETVRAAEERLDARGAGIGRRCRVAMDLAGPRLRTGPMPFVPGAHKLDRGRRGLLTASPSPGELRDEGHAFVLSVHGADVAAMCHGERLRFLDSHGRTCWLRVESVEPPVAGVVLDQNAVIEAGVSLEREQGAPVGVVAEVLAPADLRVTAGDRVRLLREGRLPLGPGDLTCTLAGALANVGPGHRVAFDDGRVGAVVERAGEEAIELVVTAPAGRYARLRAGKGLNFPDSALGLPSLTAEDREVLPFVVANADVVSLSFVHAAADVACLHQELVRLGRPDLAIVAKIETAAALHSLATILIEGLALPCFGVMIARGDLAVEVGFENLALVQEDILCLCEAAHVPVVWATQVLETLARTGLPARAEITDAAMGQRAECVMLNKGLHVLRAVETLSRLLAAADRHHAKKRDLFREFTEQRGVFGPG